MANFCGTIEDFDRFLMPRIRNRVQTLARPLKERSGGACEMCGKRGVTLEAAHVHGRGRKTIVREVLEKYRSGDGFHIGDLDAFEQEVVNAHEPVGETFLFLCRDCHREYDSEEKRDARATSIPALAYEAGPSRTDNGMPGLRSKYATRSTDGQLARDFYDYLLASGYTEYTKSGNRGTAYSYKNAVDKVCKWENCSLDELAERIEGIVSEYSPGGIKAKLGMKSNRTVINGLRAFERFCATREYHRPR